MPGTARPNVVTEPLKPATQTRQCTATGTETTNDSASRIETTQAATGSGPRETVMRRRPTAPSCARWLATVRRIPSLTTEHGSFRAQGDDGVEPPGAPGRCHPEEDAYPRGDGEREGR